MTQKPKRHAFLIMAHTEPEMLRLLLHALDHPRADLFVHVDPRAADVNKALKTTQLRAARLHRVCPAQHVCWADISQVKTELNLFAAARNINNFAYYHLLSGVDFPLRPIEEILNFFDLHQGKEFIGFWYGDHHQHDLHRKTQYVHLFTRYLRKRSDLLLHKLTSPLRKLWVALQKAAHYRRYPDYIFYKGYNWCSITTECCDFLLARRSEILRTYRHVLAPDEIYKQTLVMQSPLRERLYDLHDISKGTGRLIRWQSGGPYTWKSEDLAILLASPCLFARKVSLECATLLARHNGVCP